MQDPNYDRLIYWLRGPQHDRSNPWRDWSRNALVPGGPHDKRAGTERMYEKEDSYFMDGNSPIGYVDFRSGGSYYYHLPRLDGDFTIEMSFFFNDPGNTNRWSSLMGVPRTGDPGTWGIYQIESRKLRFLFGAPIGSETFIDSNSNVFEFGYDDFRIAVCRAGETVRLYSGGIKVGEGTCNRELHGSAFHVGGECSIFSNRGLDGKLYSAKIYSGIAKYTGDSYPIYGEPDYDPTYPPELLPAKYRGQEKISGTVKIKGTPDGDAEVFLFSEDDNSILLSGKTDPVGRFTFSGLNNQYKYYVLAKTSMGNWEHIVSSKRTPAYG